MSGANSYIGQTSLDLAEQGINVLRGRFEIKNTQLMHKLLQQYMKDVLPVGLADNEPNLHCNEIVGHNIGHRWSLPSYDQVWSWS